MNEVMFVTGGELLQFLPISSKKRVGMSICFFGHLKEEKYKWASGLYKNFNYEDKKGIAPACLPREKETG